MFGMKMIVYMVVAGVFVNTVMTVEKKQVNIALETVMKFGGKRDQSSGLDVIDKVQNALEKIKEGIEIRNGRRSSTHDHGITFTDFVLEAAKILKNYNDNDLEDVFAVIGDETRRYINRNGELHELFGSSNMRRHLSEQLEDLREMQADMLREHLNTAIITVKNKKYNGEKNDLLDIGDFVYIGGHDKLRAVLRDLEKLGRSTDVRLENVLRHTLRSLIFDHFSKLNYNIKRELIEMAKDYWRVSSSKQWNRQTRPTTLTSLEMDYTSKSDKHVYRNRVSFNAHKRQEISDVRPIQRTKKTYNASQHVNKRYKYRNRIPKDREAVTAFTKLNKYKDVTRLTLSDENINPAFEPESDNKTTVENKKSSKVSRKHVKKNKFTPSITLTQTKKPKLSKDDSDKPIDSPYSDFMLLTGGQNVQEVDLRGQSSGETNEDYEEPDKTNEEQQASKKTVVGYHPTAKYLSIERFITIKKKKIPEAKEEKDDKRVVSVTVANISGEGLSIESYENDYDLEIEHKLEKNRKLENDRNHTNNRELVNAHKIKNNGKRENNHEFKNDRKLENKVIRKYIKNDKLEIEHSEAENDRELENDHELKNYRKLENKVIRKYIKNDTLEIENSEDENDSELEDDSKLKNHRKLENKVIRKNIKNDTVEIKNSEAENYRELENDRKHENKVNRKYIKNDTLEIENSEPENDSELENDSKLQNDRKLENKVIRKYINNDTLEIENSEAENDPELDNNRKVEDKVIRKYIKNDTLEIHHSEAENDSELENDSKLKNDRKLEDKVIRIYIKNDTLKNENIEAEKESELENESNLKNERKLEKKVMRKYIKNDTFEIENSETPIDVKNMIKKIEKQMADVREKVHEGFENDREFDNKVMRKYNKNDTLRINNSEATIYLKSKINKIQKQIEDVRGHVYKGFENNREFENDHKFENQVIRKYIKNDTFNIDNSEAPIDVKYMIKNIEKQIDEVREQVEYVKNLSNIDDKSSKQNFRANSEKVTLRSSSKNKTKNHYLDSESLERDNRAFFSRASSESESSSSIEIPKKSGLAFRADYATNYAARNDTVTNISKTTKSVIVDKTSNTAHIDRVSQINFLLSKIKDNVKVKDSVEEADKTILNDASKTAFNNNKIKDFNINNSDTIPFTVNMKLNEIDTTTENTTVVKRSKRGFYWRFR